MDRNDTCQFIVSLPEKFLKKLGFFCIAVSAVFTIYHACTLQFIVSVIGLCFIVIGLIVCNISGIWRMEVFDTYFTVYRFGKRKDILLKDISKAVLNEPERYIEIWQGEKRHMTVETICDGAQAFWEYLENTNIETTVIKE